MSDLDQAKEIIGKTVELEFKIPYEGDGSDQKQSRQLFAESLLTEVTANPETMPLVALRERDSNVVYHTYS